MADIHPLLQAALAKAKPLLNPTLFRTLEATVSDAVQLAILTGGAGQQNKPFSSASIITGTPPTDRHIRRKADTMCRNLTDLCLALCDGKHESPSVSATASPAGVELGHRSSPSVKYARSGLTPAPSTARPLSRLEARKSSILGPQSLHISHRSTDDPQSSPADFDSSPLTPSFHGNSSRRVSRAASGLLRSRHVLAPDHPYFTAADDDPPHHLAQSALRPPSRAMTEVNALFRTRLGGPNNASTPAAPSSTAPSTTLTSRPFVSRVPSLRDSLPDTRRRRGSASNNNNNPPTGFETSTPVYESRVSSLARFAQWDPRVRRGSAAQVSASAAAALVEEDGDDVEELEDGDGEEDDTATAASYARQKEQQQRFRRVTQHARRATTDVLPSGARGVVVE